MNIETWNPHLQVEDEVIVGARKLPGMLSLPADAEGLVLFAHGSGSSRLSSRNRHVASVLQQAGLGTLLFDLLQESEAEDRRKVFDIELLAERLQEGAEWAGSRPETRRLPLGYFGASTGAAAALVAAARSPAGVGAVVSRGGRPDLAHRDLPNVAAPTLLIVGGDDEQVLELNRRALALLRCPKELTVIPGATHLFPEPGALDKVATRAKGWFLKYLPARALAQDTSSEPRRGNPHHLESK